MGGHPRDTAELPRSLLRPVRCPLSSLLSGPAGSPSAPSGLPADAEQSPLRGQPASPPPLNDPSSAGRGEVRKKEEKKGENNKKKPSQLQHFFLAAFYLGDLLAQPSQECCTAATHPSAPPEGFAAFPIPRACSTQTLVAVSSRPAGCTPYSRSLISEWEPARKINK